MFEHMLYLLLYTDIWLQQCAEECSFHQPLSCSGDWLSSWTQVEPLCCHVHYPCLLSSPLQVLCVTTRTTRAHWPLLTVTGAYVCGTWPLAERWPHTLSIRRGSALWSTMPMNQTFISLDQKTVPVRVQLARAFLSVSFTSSLSLPTVKLWCSNNIRSIVSVPTKANVCSVRFSPKNRYHIVYGSAGTLLSTESCIIFNQCVAFLQTTASMW